MSGRETPGAVRASRSGAAEEDDRGQPHRARRARAHPPRRDRRGSLRWSLRRRAWRGGDATGRSPRRARLGSRSATRRGAGQARLLSASTRAMSSPWSAQPRCQQRAGQRGLARLRAPQQDGAAAVPRHEGPVQRAGRGPLEQRPARRGTRRTRTAARIGFARDRVTARRPGDSPSPGIADRIGSTRQTPREARRSARHSTA